MTPRQTRQLVMTPVVIAALFAFVFTVRLVIEPVLDAVEVYAGDLAAGILAVCIWVA